MMDRTAQGSPSSRATPSTFCFQLPFLLFSIHLPPSFPFSSPLSFLSFLSPLQTFSPQLLIIAPSAAVRPVSPSQAARDGGLQLLISDESGDAGRQNRGNKK